MKKATKKTAAPAPKAKSSATAEQILKDINKLADKLNRVPEKHEYLTEGKYPEWQIRKAFGGWSKALSASGALRHDDPEVSTLNDIRAKFVSTKRENDRLKHQVDELTKEALTSKVLKGLIGEIKEENPKGKIAWMTPKKHSEGTKGIPILFLSDIHFDEVVSPEQIQGLNEFNRDIAVKRLQHCFNQAIFLLSEEIKNPTYDGIVLALGGDILSGNIHEELAISNENAILVSCVALLDILIAGVEKLKARFGRVFVPCVVGNHGRMHKKPRAKDKVFDNYEWVVYTFLQRHFANDPNVTVVVPDGSDCQFSIYDKSILLTHGDQFRGGSGIAGIFTPLMLGMARKQKRSASVKRPFDLMMVGHFHQLIMTNSLIINGSVKGYDEYAYQNNFGFEPPQQALMVIHPVHGITHQMPIICDSYSREDKELSGSKIKAIW